MKTKTSTQTFRTTNRYKREREYLIKAFVAHQDSDPMGHFQGNIGNKLLLQEIVDAGSVSQWISLQILPPDNSGLPFGRYQAGDYIYEYCQCPDCI